MKSVESVVFQLIDPEFTESGVESKSIEKIK